MNYTIKINKYYLLFCILLIGLSDTIHAQNDTSLRLDEKMTNYHINNYKERLFIHTDKSFYVAGEDLWMKFYLTEALSHKPSTISKIVYVELIDKNNISVLRDKFKLEEGIGEGSFNLPNEMLSGNYIIRAYTQWMRNEGQNSFFEQNITLVNTLNEVAKTPNTFTKPVIEFHFFPEGGHLMNGIESTIAFKAVNEYEQGVDCHGWLLNDKRDTLVKFSSFKFGMGKFNFKPKLGEHYQAIVKVGDSLLYPFFPKIEASGYTLHLNDHNSDSIIIHVNKIGTIYEENLYLLQHGLQFSKKSKVQLTNNGQAYFAIPKNALNDGVNIFTIFNSNLKPVCERSYFKFPKQRLNIAISTDQEIYDQRSPVQIGIKTNLNYRSSEMSNLSMSVFLIDTVESPLAIQDIESYLLLSKSLNGFVESPSCYFDTTLNQDAKKIAIDHLMLTQGWSSYQWEEILGVPKPKLFLPEVEGPLVQAKILYRKNNLPAKDILTYFSIPGNPFYLSTSKSNQNGELVFNLKTDLGATEAILQASANSDTAYTINTMDPFENRSFKLPKKPFLLFNNFKTDLLKRSISSQVENVFDKTNNENRLLENANDSLPFFGKPTKTYFLDDYTRFTSMEELTHEYIQEVKIKKKGKDFSIYLWNHKFNAFHENPPLMMVDGVPIFNTNKLFDFDPFKIKKIDILTQTNLTGNLFSNGVINYSTYNGDLANFPIDENALVMEYKGAQSTKQFYSPNYSTIQQKNSNMPDLRNVLLWEPTIQIQKDEQKLLQFYTGDLPGKYAMVIQGISLDGMLGSSLKYIYVQ